MKFITRVTLILVGICASVSTYACSDIVETSERLTCQKDAEKNAKSQMLGTYSDLHDYLSDIREYQIQIELSQNIWTDSSTQNCLVYAYFVEEGSAVHEMTVSECMTEEYIKRKEFLVKTKTVVEQFF